MSLDPNLSIFLSVSFISFEFSILLPSMNDILALSFILSDLKQIII